MSLPELHHTLTQAVAEGRGPDLAVIDSVRVAELSAAGFLSPLDDIDAGWVAREYERDFLEPFVSANRRDGRPVAVQAPFVRATAAMLPAAVVRPSIPAYPRVSRRSSRPCSRPR